MPEKYTVKITPQAQEQHQLHIAISEHGHEDAGYAGKGNYFFGPTS